MNNTAGGDGGRDDGIEVWEAVLALSEGMRIRVNDRDSTLTVTGTRERPPNGSVRVVSLQGGGTVFELHCVIDEPCTPMLTFPSASQNTPVVRVEPVGETIIASVTTQDLIGVVNTAREVDEPLPVDDSEVRASYIGYCVCNRPVIEWQERAVCTECGRWCLIEQWEAYHDHGKYLDQSRQTASTGQASFDSFQDGDG